jgi:hypothetical protein
LLAEALQKRLIDIEEAVRVDTIRSVMTVAFKDGSAVNEALLDGVKERALDKKVSRIIFCRRTFLAVCCTQGGAGYACAVVPTRN